MQGNESGNGPSVAQWREHVSRAYARNAARIAAALSRTYGAACAEDAVQESYLRALSWRRDPEVGDRVMSYRFMRRCAARAAQRLFRTESRRTRREREWLESARSACPWADAPSARAQRKERCDAAAAALSELPSWQRPAVQMMLVDRRTYSDVARITGVRPTTLNNWRHRATAEMRGRIDPQD